MDPNETLKEIRQCMEMRKNGTYSPAIWSSALEKFQALDEWLSKGGFLPTDWAKGQIGKW